MKHRRLLLWSFLLSGCTHNPIVPACAGGETHISFSRDVLPLITQRCATRACHSPLNASSVLTISNFQQVKSNVDNVRTRVSGKSMPVGAPLSDCELKTIVNWIDQGALDN